MKKRIISLSIVLFFATSFLFAQNQDSVSSSSDFFVAQPATDRIVVFNTGDEGISTPIIWGLDLAWLNEGNVRRGVAFMG
ncbi:MAG TPA: hypothetical protein PK978_03460, partial [Paludibacter sp.]|nr:hypothetical protein [Paludibacter sp.]